MARTALGSQLTQQHRAAQLAIRAAVIRELQLLWPAFDPTEFDTFDRFLVGAIALIQGRYRDSAGIAAAYFQTFRSAEGVRSVLDVRVPPRLSPGIIGMALRGGGLLGTLNARRAGQNVDQAAANGFVRVAGVAGSLVLDGGRATVLDAIRRDPERPRWQRVTSGRPCAFCAMLASRGPVYRDADRAAFQAHDHCSCTPEAAYNGSQMPTVSRQLRDQWRQATRGLSGTDALNAFRRSLDGGGAPAAAETTAA